MWDDIRFQMLHRRLMSQQRDGKRFIQELEKISRENPDLPETFHAWLVWSWHWDRLLKYLEANIEFCINQQGEISIIANMLKKWVIASLRANPDILKKAPMTINYWERTITLNNLYEIYQHLGLSAIDVIRTILAQLEVKSKEHSERAWPDSQPLVWFYNTPRNEIVTWAPPSTVISTWRIIHHAWTKRRKGGVVIELPMTLWLWVNYSERILRVFRHIQVQMNGSLALGFGPEDLVENAFWSISLSTKVQEWVREMLKAYFPKGYFDQAQLTK